MATSYTIDVYIYLIICPPLWNVGPQEDRDFLSSLIIVCSMPAGVPDTQEMLSLFIYNLWVNEWVHEQK